MRRNDKGFDLDVLCNVDAMVKIIEKQYRNKDKVKEIKLEQKI